MADEVSGNKSVDDRLNDLSRRIEALRGYALQTARQAAATYQAPPLQPRATFIRGTGWQEKRKRFIGDGRTTALIVAPKGAGKPVSNGSGNGGGGSSIKCVVDVAQLDDPAVLRFYFSDGTQTDIPLADCPE